MNEEPFLPAAGLREDLRRITDRFEQADRCAKRAATVEDREAAEQQRREAEGDFFAAGRMIADLFCLLLRYAIVHRPDALRLYLADILRPELEPMADCIARLEAALMDMLNQARKKVWSEGEKPRLTTLSDIELLPMPTPPPWPTLPPEALYGLAGDIVTTLAPETEADPLAILGQTLTLFGNAAGRSPSFPVEGDFHHTNLFMCLVGDSARGRKGTSRGRVMQLMKAADENWCKKCITSGLSSGEGLIWSVRDPMEKQEPIKERGHITGYQTVLVDEGVSDKRLLADESEFGQTLKVLQREGNTLSPVLRQCWDTGRLRIPTKNNPASATGAHVSLSAHVTKHELNKLMKDTEAFNGFANRFLWLCVKRSQLLPDGGRNLDVSSLGNRLRDALSAAQQIGQMNRSQAARSLWHEVYPVLTADRQGLYGAVTGRAEAQVLRLSMLYALLDGTETIKDTHLRAALALWSYADASAQIVFGTEAADPIAKLVLYKLRDAGDMGMTRTELHNAFSRNIAAEKLLEALAKLRDAGHAVCDKAKTGKRGAPAERWYARQGDELNELNPKGDDAGIDSLNSFIRRPSVEGATEEREEAGSIVTPFDE